MGLKTLSVAKFVATLNDLGCDVSEQQYRGLLRSLTRLAVKRSLQKVRTKLHGKITEKKKTVEELEDPEQIDSLKVLRATLNEHLNLSAAFQRDPDEPEPETADED